METSTGDVDVMDGGLFSGLAMKERRVEGIKLSVEIFVVL